MGKFTNSQRDHLRQFVIEAEIQRFNRTEAKTYIESKIGQTISHECIDRLKAQIKRQALKPTKQVQNITHGFYRSVFPKDRRDPKVSARTMAPLPCKSR